MKKIIFLFIVLFTLVLVGCKEPEPNKYTIEFIGLDGIVLETQELLEGAEIIYPEDPVVEGHDFFGWDINVSVATSDTTITAIYEAHTFTVKFYDYNRKLFELVSYERGEL